MPSQSQDADKPGPPIKLPVNQPLPEREVDSDVEPQRRLGEPPMPDESDNIPGDASDPGQA